MRKSNARKHNSGWRIRQPIVIVMILALAWVIHSPVRQITYQDFVDKAKTKSATVTSNKVDDSLFPTLKRLNQTLLSTATNDTSNLWEKELLERLDRIRERCGELCTISDRAALERYTVQPWNESSAFLRPLRVPLDCDTIMMDEELDKGDSSAPQLPPDVLMPFYTLHGLAEFDTSMYFNQTYLEGNAYTPVWSETMINEWIEKVRPAFQRRPYKFSGYGVATTRFVRVLRNYITLTDKRVLVIGTENPWLEAAALILGAAEVVTLEYGKIISEHPRISTLTPAKIRELYRSKQLDLFDVVLTFSSLEHPGLGRYGDALNPWGDILAAAKA